MEIISTSSGNNTNFTHTTPSGLTNSVLVVGVGTHQGIITGVTYNGTAMTQIAVGSSAFDEDGSVWLLLNPDAGANTVAITRSGGSWHGAYAITLSGVKQTTTVTNAKVDSASGSASTVSVTPPDGNVFVFAAAGGEATYTGTYSPTSGNFTTLTSASFENLGILYYFLKTGMPQTVTLNMSSGQRYGMAVLCLVEPDGGVSELGNINRHLEVKDGMLRSESAT